MRGRLLRWLPMVAVLALLVAALWIAADAESAESRLGAAYGWLFGVCAAAVLVLVVAIARELWRLWRERAEARPGARLNARLAALFGLIALPPTLLVAGFALRFLDAGVDSWFRVDLEAAHEAARALGEQVLVGEQRQALARVEARAAELDFALEVEGEMHADAALSHAILEKVMPRGRLSAEANLLIMPNLDAANIAFNLLKVTTGQGITVGPILLGAAKPAHLLTPTSTVRRIVNMTALAVVDAGAGR